MIQAQTAIERPKSFDIEHKYPGIIVFEILKMKREIVFTGIKDHNKKQHQLFVANTDNYNTQCFDLENKPYNITSLDDDIVALSYPEQRKVDMINIKTGRLDQSIKVKSFAIFQIDDQLFVIDLGKIKWITKAGCYIESFNLPTHMIDHISVYEKRLYYTCNESLYCCELNGTLIWKFKPKNEKRLSGVTTDRHGSIYVSSADPVNVLVISHEGHFLQDISYDFSNETKPVKLHFDKQDNYLAILRNSNNVIDFVSV